MGEIIEKAFLLHVSYYGDASFCFGISLALGGFVFAMDPGILLIGTPIHVAWSVFATLVGVVSLSACTVGFLKRKCNTIMRIVLVLGVGGCLMLWPGLLTDAIGIGGFAACLIINLILNRKDKRVPAALE